MRNTTADSPVYIVLFVARFIRASISNAKRSDEFPYEGSLNSTHREKERFLCDSVDEILSMNNN